MKKTESYSGVLKQLEDMVQKMNDGKIPIDELGDQVKNAASMINFLRKRLKSVEVEITEVLKDLEKEDEKIDE
jgi:exodeoxyribonuclease VII small subunit